MKTNFMDKLVITVSIMAMVFIAMILFSGCEAMDNFAIDGADGMPSKLDQVGGAAATAGSALGTAGLPWGWIMASIGGACTSIAGIYENMRKKQQLATADDKAAQTEIIMRAIIDAVETSQGVQVSEDGTNIGDIVKRIVEDNLKENDMYQVGKAVIAALKGA